MPKRWHVSSGAISVMDTELSITIARADSDFNVGSPGRLSSKLISPPKAGTGSNPTTGADGLIEECDFDDHYDSDGH